MKKKIKYLKEKLDKLQNSDEPWYIKQGTELELERKIKDINLNADCRWRFPHC